MVRKRKYDWDKVKEDYLSGMSMPNLRKKYGVSYSACFNIIHKEGVSRSFSEAILLYRSGQTRYRKLPRVGHALTRVVSIPASFIMSLGIDASKELLGEWVIEDGKLCLKIIEKNQSLGAG